MTLAKVLFTVFLQVRHKATSEQCPIDVSVWAILVEDLSRTTQSNLVEIHRVVIEMSFEVISILCSGGHFVQRSGMIWAILVEDLPRNNPIKFGWNSSSGYRENVIAFYFYFSSDGHFLHWTRTIRATLIEDLPRNNPIMFGWKPSSYKGDVVWCIF